MASAGDDASSGRVVFLAGPVAAGKTTVARALVPLLAGHVVAIEGDAFWHFIARSDRPRREDFHVLLRSMTAAAAPWARAGSTVLLDFSTPPQFMPMARKILKELAIAYVVLDPGIEVCRQRAAAREQGRIDDYENGYREFGELFDSALARRHAIEEGVDAADTARRIAEALATERLRID